MFWHGAAVALAERGEIRLMAEAMKASLLLTLDDQLSGGINHLMEVLDKLIGTADRLQGAFTQLADKLDGMFTRAAQKAGEATERVGLFERALSHLGETAGQAGARLDSLWGGIGRIADRIGGLGGIAAGVSVVAPVEAAADFENVLTHIAITEKLSGDAVAPEVARLKKLFYEDSQRTGQSSESIAKAYMDLVQTGIPAAILDRVIGAHSQAATAYNISPDALGPAVAALLQNFKIPEGDIGAALSAMALASKEGRFKVEDFSRQLPGVSGFMSTLGMGGREGADVGFAALETVMRNAGEPNQAAADFSDALNYLTGTAAKRAFKQSGVDLPELLESGEKAGKNPIDTILDKLTEMTSGQDPIKMSETLHAVLHNQQAEQALMALLQHRGEFNTLKGKLDQANPATFQTDFETAHKSTITDVRLFHENVAEVTRTAGEGFAPALAGITRVLHDVQDGLSGLNAAFPTTMSVIEGGTGVVLAFGSAVGLISLVAGGPVAVAIAAVVALAVAADEIYAHWRGIKDFFKGIWDSFLDGANAAVAAAEKLATAPSSALTTDAEGHRLFSGGKGLHPMPQGQVNVHVSADPGLKVQTTTSGTGVTTTSPGDETRTVGRP